MTIAVQSKPGDGGASAFADDQTCRNEIMRRPLVELRRGFSLGYDAPSEDTSTIVLTAPSGKFVDMRFSTLPKSEDAAEVKEQLGKIHGYAAAGMSTVSFPSKEDPNCPPYDCHMHVRWEHAIDSSNAFDTDGADMILLGNGDTMEVGFVNIRGTIKYFKEYWIIPPNRATNAPCFVAELDSSNMASPTGAVRTLGMAVRIGDFCQAILQTPDGFWYERWEQDQEKRWEKDARSNTPSTSMPASGILPCMWLTSKSVIDEGTSMELSGRVWNITESVY